MNHKPCCHENTICQEKLAKAWKLAEHVQLAMATLFDNKSCSSVRLRVGYAKWRLTTISRLSLYLRVSP